MANLPDQPPDDSADPVTVDEIGPPMFEVHYSRRGPWIWRCGHVTPTPLTPEEIADCEARMSDARLRYEGIDTRTLSPGWTETDAQRALDEKLAARNSTTTSIDPVARLCRACQRPIAGTGRDTTPQERLRMRNYTNLLNGLCLECGGHEIAGLRAFLAVKHGPSALTQLGAALRSQLRTTEAQVRSLLFPKKRRGRRPRPNDLKRAQQECILQAIRAAAMDQPPNTSQPYVAEHFLRLASVSDEERKRLGIPEQVTEMWLRRNGGATWSALVQQALRN
jgi:hypothetical protein